MNPNEQPQAPSIDSFSLSSESQRTHNQNYWKAGIILLVILVVLGAYYLGTSQKQFTPMDTTRSQTAITQAINPTSITTSNTNPDIVPKKNTLYIAEHEGKKAIFFTNQEEQRYYDTNSVEQRSEYRGTLKTTDSTLSTNIDYRKLSNPRPFFSSPRRIYSIAGPSFNVGSNYFYTSVVITGTAPDTYSFLTRVYQIDMTTLAYKEVWSDDKNSNKFPGYSGTAYLDQVSQDKYLALHIGKCEACDAADSPIVVILNIESGKEKYLGVVGEVQFNGANNTVTYKRIGAFDEPCEPSPRCENGKTTVYKPSGQTLTDTLP